MVLVEPTPGDPHLWRAIAARITLAIYHLDKGETEAARALLAQLETVLPDPAPHNLKAARGRKGN